MSRKLSINAATIFDEMESHVKTNGRQMRLLTTTSTPPVLMSTLTFPTSGNYSQGDIPRAKGGVVTVGNKIHFFGGKQWGSLLMAEQKQVMTVTFDSTTADISNVFFEHMPHTFFPQFLQW